MRLIELERAKKEILEWAVVITKPHLLSKEDTLHVLDTLPTIEAEPVRHGRWEDRANPQWPAYDIRHCSVCGWNIPKTKLRNKDANWNYCPHCGAKMDGDSHAE